VGVRAGRRHVCALAVGAQQGNVLCWGTNGSGQLGLGDQANQFSPTAVKNPSGSAPLDSVSALAAGAFHACAIRNGHPVCWGNNVAFAMGDGTDTNRLVPVLVTLP